MRVAIIEDEIPACEQLISLLRKVNPGIEVAFTAQSVKEAVVQFKAHKELDLAIMDIQLNDGLSLELFELIIIEVPVIFATAYDQYILKALQLNGIDYILKPIKQRELTMALNKYKSLQQHFTRDISQLANILNGADAVYRKRILVRKGGGFSSVAIGEIRYFFSEHKVTFLVDDQEQKLIVDEPLSEIEMNLDPDRFFRVNRSLIASIESIDKFHSDGKGRLKLTINPGRGDEITVSQEKAAAFKQWYAGI